MPCAEVSLKAASADQLLLNAYEHAYEQGWTDGLPIIPATRERVDRFIEASGREPGELIGVLPPRKGEATVEVIAINAVMAGCRPEYINVVIAAIDALCDPGFSLELMQVTTNPMCPLIIVNGPVRRKLEINSGIGCLGPGWRANSTIGRAVRLVLNNVGGALPGVYSKSTFSSPLRYSYICGENEEENPWRPLHVDRGFSKDDSTVTVFRAANYQNISGGEGADADEILRHIASNMPPMFGAGDGAMLMLGLNHATALHRAGLSKRDIQERLWKFARLPAEYFAKSFVESEITAGRSDGKTVWRCNDPSEMHVLVCGGPGPQDVYIGAGMPRTRLVHNV
jgi:hypothetical protein